MNNLGHLTTILSQMTNGLQTDTENTVIIMIFSSIFFYENDQ